MISNFASEEAVIPKQEKLSDSILILLFPLIANEQFCPFTLSPCALLSVLLSLMLISALSMSAEAPLIAMPKKEEEAAPFKSKLMIDPFSILRKAFPPNSMPRIVLPSAEWLIMLPEAIVTEEFVCADKNLVENP